MKLAFPMAPVSENPPGSLRIIASKFANDVARLPDKIWLAADGVTQPFRWRNGRIVISFRFVTKARVVKVLSVEVSDVDDGPNVFSPDV